MPRIGNPVSVEDQLCERCGSKRKISKTWIEEIKNDHGSMILRHTQVVCTNKECQKAFEKVILEDIEKREKIKQAKIDHAAKNIVTKPTA